MRVLHRRVIGTIALGLWLVLGWDSRVYWGSPLGLFPWLPLAFYFFAGASLVWIITEDNP